MATEPCRLARLGDTATWADLEAAYVMRGVHLADCDLARRLALETLAAERLAIDAWLGVDPTDDLP